MHSNSTRAATVVLILIVTIVVTLPLISCKGEEAQPDGGDAATGDAGVTGHCVEGLVAQGPACIPELSAACKDNEVPLLSGECKRVGPPDPCPSGWTTASGGGCEPVLPTTSCTGAGEIEVIGESACKQLGSCGSGTYGEIKTDSQTIFVDQAYLGGGSDGSQAKPYTTIGAAIQAASTSTASVQIAVAAGEYAEELKITSGNAVALRGRCAKLVTIKGQSSEKQAAAVKIFASGTSVQGVTITGPAAGIWLNAATKVELKQVIIQNCEAEGIVAISGTELTVTDARIVNNRAYGMKVDESSCTVERSVVRDSRTRADGTQGLGIRASNWAKPASLTLRDSLVAGNHGGGVAVWGSKATLQRSVVRDTQGFATGQFGTGIQAAYYNGSPAVLVVEDSLVAGNRNGGILASSSEVTVERTVVRDNLEQASDQTGGAGILANARDGPSSTLTVKECLVDANRSGGIVLMGSTGVVEGTLVRNTREQAKGKTHGFGVHVEADFTNPKLPASELTLRESIVELNHEAGINIRGSTATLERVVVRETQSMVADKTRGIGIQAAFAHGKASTLTMRECLVQRNRLLGIDLKGSEATIERTVIGDTLPQEADGAFGSGIQALPIEEQAAERSTVTMRDCLVEKNRTVGVVIADSQGTLERVVVRDTQPQESDKKDGTGVAVFGINAPAAMTMDSCVVERSRATGIFIAAADAKIVKSVISDTGPETASAGYGDGIQIGHDVNRVPKLKYKASLQLEETTVDKSARAGAAFYDAGGSVRRSVFRRGVFAINLGKEANPQIAEDNVYEENEENRVTRKAVQPAPPPEVPGL